jgi:hypothetical protein
MRLRRLPLRLPDVAKRLRLQADAAAERAVDAALVREDVSDELPDCDAQLSARNAARH